MLKKTIFQIGGFALLCIMLLKVVDIHVYTHDDYELDSIENCQICDFAYEEVNNDFFIVASPSVNLQPNHSLRILPILDEATSAVENQVLFRFFGRPPPSSL